jgi:hypothetical protein
VARKGLERDAVCKDHGKHVDGYGVCTSEATPILQFADVGFVADCVRFPPRACKSPTERRGSHAIFSGGRARCKLNIRDISVSTANMVRVVAIVK